MPRQIVSILGGVVQDVCTITDRIPDDGETVVASAFSMAPGGKGANSAVAVHRLTRPKPKNRPPATAAADSETQEFLNLSNLDQVLGDDEIESPAVCMVGAVGADQFGPALKENLKDCGVNVDGVRVVEGGQTAVGNIVIESCTRENRIMQYPGVSHGFQPSDFMTVESLGGGVRPDLIICQLELHREAIEQAIETAGREGIDVLLNPSPAFYLMPEIYRKITHLVVNETEAVLLSEIEPDDIENQTGWTKVADSFLALGVKNVVVTLGANGAYYSNEYTSGHVEAEKNVAVRDTSGAGDSFVGAYTAEWLSSKQTGKWDIRAAVENGCKASARVIEHVGCLEPICWADEIGTSLQLPQELEKGPEDTPEKQAKAGSAKDDIVV